MRDIGLYIHIPFCKSKCYYCDFVSYPNKESLAKDYVNAVIKEIKHANLSRYNIKTVYIGGRNTFSDREQIYRRGVSTYYAYRRHGYS